MTVLHTHELTVSYMPDVAFVAIFYILDCPFGFLTRLFFYH